MASEETAELAIPLSFLKFEIYRYVLAAMLHSGGLSDLGAWFDDLASLEKCSKALERFSTSIV
jgi:hypothetical protein